MEFLFILFFLLNHFTLVMFFSLIVIFNSDYLKIRYGDQLFSQIIDKDKREKYFEGNLYLKLYQSGYAVF